MKSSYPISTESKGFSTFENAVFYFLFACIILLALAALILFGAFIASSMIGKNKEYKLAIRLSGIISIFMVPVLFAHFYPILSTHGPLFIFLWFISAFLFSMWLLTKILFIAYLRVKTTETDKHYRDRSEQKKDNTRPVFTPPTH